ncbi:RNA polymerase sigma factor [Oceanicoccus sp. KOV_DT_Chl]|uniref:RNA polymerase sigma factor n=1 Tax=Oceanicoccus sp. KOV_DT_Chl TaxID=1904639 RepID=UPI000C7BA868|nr:sigma-70 family RNA polymerase sigma factor [Oceanicoccus sp. KOV_DT_Chl]
MRLQLATNNIKIQKSSATNEFSNKANVLNDDTDKKLLNAISAGDETAMEVFYKRHSHGVHQFAMKTVLNHHDAAEVLNEVMLEVWKTSKRYSGRSKVTTWLLSITHHKSVDLIRKKSRHDNNEVLDQEFTEEHQPNPATALTMNCDAMLLRQAIQQLPTIHRQVIHMVFFEGCSYPEIATVLNIPVGTVKTRMMHAKAHLLKILNNSADQTMER